MATTGSSSVLICLYAASLQLSHRRASLTEDSRVTDCQRSEPTERWTGDIGHGRRHRMATTKPIQLRALVAATGALSAVIMLAGPFAGNAVATPAPPTPVVSGATVHFSKNHAYLTLQTTPCT